MGDLKILQTKDDEDDDDNDGSNFEHDETRQ